MLTTPIFYFFCVFIIKSFIMKKVKLTEKQLEELVLKVLEEQGAIGGASSGMNRSEINNLPKCSKKDAKELINGVVKQPVMSKFQYAAIATGTGTELYLEVKNKPFCKLR